MYLLSKFKSFFTKTPKILILCGPTGSGKTQLSLQLAIQLNGEIINADSVQQCKELQIGCNKIQAHEMKGIKHHLLDTQSVVEQTNVVQFANLAREVTTQLCKAKKVPILVGGSGFYLRTFRYGAPGAPQSDLKRTAQLQEELKQQGWDKSLERLMKVDEEYASKLSRNDYYRLARAIDIVERTGKRMKDFVKKDHWGDNYDFRGIVLFRDKIDLYQRIDKRCEEMIELGLMEETASLLKNNLIDKNFRVIGYHEAIEFLLNVKTPFGEDEFLSFLQQFKTASRNYAKRQYSWFRGEEDLIWVHASKLSEEQLTQRVIQLYQMSNSNFHQVIQSEENRQVIEESKGVPSGENVKEFLSKLDSLYLYADKDVLKNRIEKLNLLVNKLRTSQ